MVAPNNRHVRDVVTIPKYKMNLAALALRIATIFQHGYAMQVIAKILNVIKPK
tara:strand:- start:363 stop:521 length:159 start_codon:yes stop_codon:yes gene_type:complete